MKSRTAAPASISPPRGTARRRSATTKGTRAIPGFVGLRRRHCAAGFTLIEIVLVLVVLSVAGVLVAPALQPVLLAVRGEAAARRTAAFLDDVRRRAVIERRVLRVSCRAEENRLAVQAADGAETGFAIPEEASLASCRPEEIAYFPQGYASGWRLALRDRRGQEYEVSVGVFTGLARVERAP